MAKVVEADTGLMADEHFHAELEIHLLNDLRGIEPSRNRPETGYSLLNAKKGPVITGPFLIGSGGKI